MFCPSCGKEIEDTSKFCKYCGYQITQPYEQKQQKNTVNELTSPDLNNLQKPKNDIKLIIGIVLVLFVLAAFGGYFIYKSMFSLHKQALELIDKKDYAKAALLLAKSCDKGDTDSCVRLADMYSNGTQIPKDYAQAINYYTIACNKNNSNACSKLRELSSKMITQPQETTNTTQAQVNIEDEKRAALDVIKAYYQNIPNNLQAAYSLLSDNFQSKQAYNIWYNGFKNTISTSIEKADLVSLDNKTAKVNVIVISNDKTKQGVIQTTYKGNWELVKINNDWKLDSANIQKVSENIVSSNTNTQLEKNTKQSQQNPPEKTYTTNDLFKAISNSDAALVKKILAQGISPNIRDKNGSTPLMYAAYYGNLEICQILLAHGADVNARSAVGGTALGAAKEGGHQNVYNLLLQRGATF